MDKKYIDKRESLIKSYIQDKEVLDLGVGDISVRFLHKTLRQYAKTIIGVELDQERTKHLISLGYNIIEGNAETIDLGKKFDVIVAGDLIEHLENLGTFLENIKKHLKHGGYFLFNTPNAYSINFLLRGLLLGGNVSQFNEHTLLFTEQLIENLLGRYGLKIEKIIYFTHEENNVGSYFIRLFAKISKKRNEHMFFVIKN